ncbi:hypothetical protein ACQKQA_28835 [Pseudomonas sp. NPDC089530]|uniref:hypothetical protein n=1 Tax=Pseudomonas sp. NPDC089530 TaxID=3390651 RepID=UPI003D073ECA
MNNHLTEFTPALAGFLGHLLYDSLSNLGLLDVAFGGAQYGAHGLVLFGPDYW